MENNEIDPAILAEYAAIEAASQERGPQPSAVATKEVGGRVVPIHPMACPNQEGFSAYGEDPVCLGDEREGTCCGELVSVRRHHVLCFALTAPRPEQPRVALIAPQ
jgi:hypothetical protein